MRNILVILAVIVLIASGIFNTNAANFTSMSDQMSRAQISTASNHVVAFDLPASMNFDLTGNTDVITYDFANDFVSSGTWAVADFDFNDGTERTILSITAGAGAQIADCAGTSGNNDVAITLNTTTVAFGVTPCGTYTASGDAATVTFTIYGSSGNGVLTNPGSAASYNIAMSMTDEGSAAAHSGTLSVGIIDSDYVTITATVASSLTFDIDIVANGACGTATPESAAPYTLDLGTITSAAVKTATNSICINDVDSTSASGVSFKVASLNDQLKSTSVPSDLIPDAVQTAGDLASGTEGYGMCTYSSGASSGSITLSTNWDGSLGSGCNTTTGNYVGNLPLTSATYSTIASSNAPLDNGYIEALVKASITTVTGAHSDYTDELYFKAIGTF